MAVVWRVRDEVEKEREEKGLGDCTWENFTDTILGEIRELRKRIWGIWLSVKKGILFCIL